RCGVHLRTISPSRSRTSRRTPCVEGYDGPMLIVTASPPPSSFSRTIDIASGPVTFEREILAQRMELEVVGHQDAPPIGMPVEDDADEIVGLALLPVGPRPDGGDGRAAVRLGEPHLQPQARVVPERVEVVEDLVLVVAIREVDAREVGEHL